MQCEGSLAKRLPLGGKKTASSLSRKRLMRGDQSAPTQRLQSLTLPPHKKSATAALCKKTYLPKHKNFPQEHPHQTKRNKSSLCTGGCSWGKFSVSEGGLEGESPVFQEGALSLQGLSSPHHILGDRGTGGAEKGSLGSGEKKPHPVGGKVELSLYQRAFRVRLG